MTIRLETWSSTPSDDPRLDDLACSDATDLHIEMMARTVAILTFGRSNGERWRVRLYIGKRARLIVKAEISEPESAFLLRSAADLANEVAAWRSATGFDQPAACTLFLTRRREESEQLRADMKAWQRATGFPDAEAVDLYLSRRGIRMADDEAAAVVAEREARLREELRQAGKRIAAVLAVADLMDAAPHEYRGEDAAEAVRAALGGER